MEQTLSFDIKTETFEGPLELLLDLIEKRKLLINDISLAQVTDEYMERVRAMQEDAMPETAHFVLIASTLLLIKSKSLLPVLELTDTEEEKIEDLEYHLKLYKLFRDRSKDLRAQFGSRMLFERPFVSDTEPLFITDTYTTTPRLYDAIYQVLDNLPKKIKKPEVSVKTVISLEETIERLRDRIAQQFKLTFKDFAGNASERGDVIISLLAVLELVKQGIVMAHQEQHFTDIHIEREDIDTPRYL